MASPVGLRLVDEFTTRPPIGAVRAALAMADAQGAFRPTGIEAVVTPTAFLVLPRLGLSRDPAHAQPRRYLFTLEADFYAPLYQATPGGTAAGIEFLASPYDATTPPTQPPLVADVALLPAPNYPYESTYPVIRGVVALPGGARVPGAQVWLGQRERVFAGERGAYSIALRGVQSTARIFAGDSQNRVGHVDVDVTDPNSRDTCQVITIQ
jgi:hypothetical protein